MEDEGEEGAVIDVSYSHRMAAKAAFEFELKRAAVPFSKEEIDVMLDSYSQMNSCAKSFIHVLRRFMRSKGRKDKDG